MRRFLAIHASLLALAIALSAGCHHSRVQTSSAPLAWPKEEHCWWAPLRTALPADSVAMLYARAYATLGLSGGGWSHEADTAWAESGPTVLSRQVETGIYAARVVAYRRGDTTLVRPFVAVQPSVGSLTIPFCGDVMRTAKAATSQPRDEVRDDSLPVWRRRPMR
jgi:hypothetical protein